MSAQEYIDARAAGAEAFAARQSTADNPYAVPRPRVPLDPDYDPAVESPKEAMLARMWLTGWQAARAADEASRTSRD